MQEPRFTCLPGSIRTGARRAGRAPLPPPGSLGRRWPAGGRPGVFILGRPLARVKGWRRLGDRAPYAVILGSTDCAPAPTMI